MKPVIRVHSKTQKPRIQITIKSISRSIYARMKTIEKNLTKKNAGEGQFDSLLVMDFR